MMSYVLMEAASSFNDCSSKSWRGCLGLVSICSIGMRMMLVTASVTFGFKWPAEVFRSASMLCNRERIPFPSASLFCLGVVIYVVIFANIQLFHYSLFLLYFGHVVFLQDLFCKVQIVHGAL